VTRGEERHEIALKEGMAWLFEQAKKGPDHSAYKGWRNES